jgi:hypothetical protein
MQDEARIGEIIRAHPHLTAALEAARDIAAPDWLVAAGAIRDAVWDALHGRAPVAPRDVDLAFFDPEDLTPERDDAVTSALCEAAWRRRAGASAGAAAVQVSSAGRPKRWKTSGVTKPVISAIIPPRNVSTCRTVGRWTERSSLKA